MAGTVRRESARPGQAQLQAGHATLSALALGGRPNPLKGDEPGVSPRANAVKPGFHLAVGVLRTVRGSVAALPRSGGYAESELRDVPSPGATAAPWRRAWPGREASAWEKCNEFLHVRMHLHSLC